MTINPESINSYEKGFNNPNNWPDKLNPSEHEIKAFLSKLGNVERILEEDKKTPDFEVDGIFVEVKSINTVLLDKVDIHGNPLFNHKDENEWIKKINCTLCDIAEKRGSVSENSLYLGVIYIDVVQAMGLGKNIFNYKFMNVFIDKTMFDIMNLDAILFYPMPVSGKVTNSKPLLISKNSKLTAKFKEAYDKEIEIVEKEVG
ncbi:hypothetical protein J7J90_04770 [Candidatus Micrarchaeota archaeon]|nr:hypothetical protein [Candidatus Micrarchaeota archaeon]